MISRTTKIPEATFDVIVIGAGINGAGIARDAAMRGLKVLLIDKGDVGGGTSSWSTRLIHGGLRYLEHGEFGLVRESLRERETLLKIAPHLVRPLPIMVPIYKGARRGKWTMRTGMIAYDLLSSGKSLPRHRMLSRADALRECPDLNPEGLVGATIYYDAQVEYAERLVIENALSAVEHGATVVTYARVKSFTVTNNHLTGVEIIDELNGSNHSAFGKILINAAGPWVDQVLEGSSNPPPLIGGTKGSHIVVAPFEGAPAVALYVEATTDHRPFFIIPWNRNYLIGTTDIRFKDNLDDVRITEDEIDYLLGETNRVISTAKLTREQILYAYAGVRPLPFTTDKDEQSITRQHFIRKHPRFDNLFSIVGGKLTTYRSLSEQAVNIVFRVLERRPPDCMTANTPLSDSDANEFKYFCQTFQQSDPQLLENRKRLHRIYGDGTWAILSLGRENPDLAEVLDDETGAIAAEVVYAFKHELAQTLTDCLLRRTMVGLNSQCGLNAVQGFGKVAQKFLGWSNERRESEIASYRKYIERFRLSNHLHRNGET